MIDLQKILAPYNPWWKEGLEASILKDLPDFHRPIFQQLLHDISELKQIVSITGPRRIGKTTLLRQLVAKLLSQETDSKRILYYSFDDPSIFTNRVATDALFDEIMRVHSSGATSEQPVYMFFDEIQRLEYWELFLKKYWDLQYPIRFIISGSASSPIFKKSRESLLGRVKEHHLLPFSYREYVWYYLRDSPDDMKNLKSLYEIGQMSLALLLKSHNKPVLTNPSGSISSELANRLDHLLTQYIIEGGFPEVWNLKTPLEKQTYLIENQVDKVIYEDLVLAAEFRKPELIKQFYLSLLQSPGQEINLERIAQDTGIKVAQIYKYLPLLELTDLVYHISRYRSGAARVRRGNMKFYLADLAVRNAVLRIADISDIPSATLGLYAENLVYLALRKWQGALRVDYYRTGETEVDFIVHTSPSTVLPIEVKYVNTLQSKDLRSIRTFVKTLKRKTADSPYIITKSWEYSGTDYDVWHQSLPFFLLQHD